MSKTEEARDILQALGLPAKQQNEMSALTLLALCNLRPEAPWGAASRRSMTVTKGIMAFIAEAYGKEYAPNTRETFRRQVLHQFVQARIADHNPDNPDLPTNSPHAHYALTPDALQVVQAYQTPQWDSEAAQFVQRQGRLREIYQKQRGSHLVPVRLPEGTTLTLSPGKHNILQAAIIEEFAPRFAPEAHLLYFGDTTKKDLYVDSARLTSLGIAVTEHGKLPDVVYYDVVKNWLFLIELDFSLFQG